MKKKLPLLILLLAAAGAAAYWYTQQRSRNGRNALRVSGNIEANDTEVSFQIPGRVVLRAVDEGQEVKKGDLVARLDETELAQQVALQSQALAAAQSALDELLAGSRPEEIAQAEAAAQKTQAALDELLAGSRPEEIAAAEAAMRKARFALDELLAGSRPEEIAAAEAAVASARADESNQKLLYQRQQALLQKGVVSTQDYDSARTAYEIAAARLQQAEAQLKLVKAGPRKEQIDQGRAALAQATAQYALAKAGPRKEDIDQARAALAQARANLELVRNGPRKEQIDQARARVGQAREALAQAQTRLGYARLVSPLTGMVLSRNIEPGEFVAAGTPVVTVADLVHVWLRAYLPETELVRVRLGQRARVTTDTYPTRAYEGRISFISSQPEFTPKSVQTEKERVKLVYRIKIDIDNPKQELKPGMPADAEILAGGAGEENAKSQMTSSRQAPNRNAQ